MTSNDNGMVEGSKINSITRPAPIATPISRADTTSASTTYAVRYHNPLSPSPVLPEGPSATQPSDPEGANQNSDESTLTNNTANEDQLSSKRTSQVESNMGVSSGRQVWHSVSNPFKRKRAEPPAEVAAQIASSNMRRSPGIRSIKNRLNLFSSGPRGLSRGRNELITTSPQVTVIPAQPRGSRRGSRVEQQIDDAPDFNANLRGTLGLNSDIPEVDEENDDQANTHVTVIPPPVRGGRTWSPDDLHNVPATSTTPDSRPQPRRSSSNIETSRQFTSTGQISNSSPTGPIHTNRSDLSLPQTYNTPGRASNSPGSFGQFRMSGRDRNFTMTSISDRLSTSPVATPGASSTPVLTNRGATITGNTVLRPTRSSAPPQTSILPTTISSTSPQIPEASTSRSITHLQSRDREDDNPQPGHVTFTHQPSIPSRSNGSGSGGNSSNDNEDSNTKVDLKPPP